MTLTATRIASLLFDLLGATPIEGRAKLEPTLLLISNLQLGARRHVESIWLRGWSRDSTRRIRLLLETSLARLLQIGRPEDSEWATAVMRERSWSENGILRTKQGRILAAKPKSTIQTSPRFALAISGFALI